MMKNGLEKQTEKCFKYNFNHKYKSSFALFVVIFFFTFYSGKVLSQSYSTLCDNGQELEKTGNFDAAINKYSDAISIKPEAWKAYYYRAKAYYSKTNYNDAITDISKAMALAPYDYSLYEIRGNCYLAKEMVDKALYDYNLVLSKAYKEDIKYILTFFNRGKALYYSKRYDDAVIDFTQSIKLGKKNPQSYMYAYYWRGISYFELNKFPEAIKDFDSYLTVYPNYEEAIFYKGFAYKKNGETEKAKTSALKIIEIDPSKEIYFKGDHLLDIYDLEMRRKVVKQSLGDAIALTAEFKTSPSKTLANIKLTEAFANLDKAWLYASAMSKSDGDLKDSILKKIFELYPQMKSKPELPELARKFMVQAGNATEEKKYNDAIKLLDKALSIAPYYAIAYFNRALLEETLKNYKAAITDAKKYIELFPDASNSRVAQDKIYEWEGKSTVYIPVQNNEVTQNKPVSNSDDFKPQFIMRGGLNIPKDEFAKTPNSQTDNTFFGRGNMGAQTGYYFEIGLGFKFSGKSKVKFYYNPLILSYSNNNMDWTKLGNFFTKTDIYKKSLRMIEVAQRYGICFVPIPKVQLAAYYRPGLIIPFDFSVYYKGNGTDSTVYYSDGTLNGKKVLMMSHSFGFTLSYSFISLSYESYFAQPTYDIRIKNHGPLPTNSGDIEERATVKIPFRTDRIGIVLSF